jgi:excisionase family DNA binding protein
VWRGSCGGALGRDAPLRQGHPRRTRGRDSYAAAAQGGAANHPACPGPGQFPNTAPGKLEPTPGLEPGTYGLRRGTGPNPEAPEESQSFTSRMVTDSATSPNVPPHPDNHGQFAALVLHESGCLVSPKEAALRLGIKRSTVYTLCAKGEIPHARVGSLVRIDIDAYLAPRACGYGIRRKRPR